MNVLSKYFKEDISEMCPICYEFEGYNDDDFKVLLSPSGYGCLSSYRHDLCCHSICVECWYKIANADWNNAGFKINNDIILCPLCRSDVTEWVHSELDYW